MDNFIDFKEVKMRYDLKLTEEGYWVPSNIIDSVPLRTGEAHQLLCKAGWFVRNTYNFDKPEPTSFWYVIKDSFGGMEELSSKKRNQVRKSLRTYDFRVINSQIMSNLGFDIENRARAHYSVKASQMSKEEFDSRLERERKEGGYEYWGIFIKGTQEMVGFSINRVMYGYCFYEYIRIEPECLGNTYPYYGLFFSMNQYYLDVKKLKFVSDGSRSITEHSNIQPFLIDTFKFRKAYCDLQVEYKWCLSLFVNLLYPFKKYMPIKVKAVLNLEGMRRGDK